jgi:hypothetical protein
MFKYVKLIQNILIFWLYYYSNFYEGFWLGMFNNYLFSKESKFIKNYCYVFYKPKT